MLKIWKETWKKDSRNESPSYSSNSETKVSEMLSTQNASDPGQSEQAPMNTQTGLINNNLNLKKHDSKTRRRQDEIMPISLKRRYASALDAVHSLPPKRRKVIADTLSRRLPELSEDYGPVPALDSYTSRMVASSSDQVQSVLKHDFSESSSIVTLKRPHDLVILYDSPARLVETHLFRRIHSLDPSETIFKRHCKAARIALTQVGACGSDLIWHRASRELEASAIIQDDTDEDSLSSEDLMNIKIKTKIWDLVKNCSFAMPNIDVTSRGFNVSPKFLKLVEVLNSCADYGKEFRGIVFVQHRSIAHVIVDLLRTVDNQNHRGFLRPCALVGNLNGRQKMEVVESFATGNYNILVATKSAQDADLPKATTVIRYDLFGSQVSYAYMRAQARDHESHFIHFVEKGNEQDRRIIHSQIWSTASDGNEWKESIFSGPSSSMPPRNLKETVDPYRSEDEDESADLPCIADPTTSGRIYPQDSTTVIHRFAACFRASDDTSHQPLYSIVDIDQPDGTKGKTCTVFMPQACSLPAVTGPLCATISEARRAASFQACQDLFHRGLLDYRFFPRHPIDTSCVEVEADTGKPKPRSALPLPSQTVDVDTKPSGNKLYLRKQPNFWPNILAAPHQMLYPTIVIPRYPTDLVSSHAAVLILTWQPLPPIEEFDLYFFGHLGSVRLLPAAPFPADKERANDLHAYTIMLCRTMTYKPFACSFEDMTYFLCPLESSWISAYEGKTTLERPEVADHIPWDMVAVGSKTWKTPFRRGNADTLAEDLENAVVREYDSEYSKPYAFIQARADLTPLSQPPEDNVRESKSESFLEWYQLHRKGFQGLQDHNQPLIEVEALPTVQNQLKHFVKPPGRRRRDMTVNKYMVPELCMKHVVPADALRTFIIIPSVMSRIDDLLLVKEINASLFDHLIGENELLIALTLPAAGMDYNYERLELLGDAFLKYLISIYVFVTCPAHHEGALHILRQKIISNRALLDYCTRSGLPMFMMSRAMAGRTWIPRNFTMAEDESRSQPKDVDADAEEQEQSEGEDGQVAESPDNQETESSPSVSKKRRKKSKIPAGIDTHIIQRFGDKTIADVAEAVIGAAYVSGGRETALRVVKALGLPVPQIDRWLDFSRKVLAPPPNVTAKLRPGTIEAVETIIGHKFQHPHLLAQALTHESIQGSETTTYERLEFIGDAILDFMVIRYIYDRDSQLTPGDLTSLKGAMVSNATLAAVCISSGLHEHLLFQSPGLSDSMDAYTTALKTKQAEEYALAKSENRHPGQYWADLEPPKALSDMLESIIGAVYVSDSFLPTGSERIFDKILKPFYDQHITLQSIVHHPTKLLYELVQAEGCHGLSLNKTRDENTNLYRCTVMLHETIVASALDATGTSAARRAAATALESLQREPGLLLKICKCQPYKPQRKVPDTFSNISTTSPSN